MANNGLHTFSLHVDCEQVEGCESLADFHAEGCSLAAPISTAPDHLRGLEPEAAARRHLQHALASAALPGLSVSSFHGDEAKFRLLSAEAEPLTGTTMVKFRQMYAEIPVYGSLVSIELDATNALVALHATLGVLCDVFPNASVSAAEVTSKLLALAGAQAVVGAGPRICYYFDAFAHCWRLVYIFENVRPGLRPEGGPLLSDYVFDANDGALVAELTRATTAGRCVEHMGEDHLGRLRRFHCIAVQSDEFILHDELLNVHTHDFHFGDVVAHGDRLPGAYVKYPPSPWSAAAVSAHANAATVVTFVRDVLKRKGIDGRGGPLISSVNCIVAKESPDGLQWYNAAWLGTQMVYGQRLVHDELRSYAACLDIVAHEVFHAITDRTARLEYAGQSGALNESYSDIFGVLVSNSDVPDRAQWNWQLGEAIDASSLPLRDLAGPSRHGQPEHMNAYVQMPMWNDAGGVHVNSGIPNHAAYKLMTAKVGEAYLFELEELAALFYLAMSRYLSRTSQFGDARRAAELVARSLFRQDPRRAQKLEAVSRAYDDVGITAALSPARAFGPALLTEGGQG